MDGGLLTVADFERNETAGDENGEGLRDEAAIDIEAVVSGEESQRWLVVADLYGKGVAVDGGDVWWIGDDDLEALFGDGGEKIAFKEANAVGDLVAVCVLAGNCKGIF